MWLLIFLLIQSFLFIVVGGFYALIIVAPIAIFLIALEFIGSLTLNNLLNGIHKIPVIGPIISGLIASGIGVVITGIGIWVFINYIFIMLRCLGGPKV